MYYAIHLLLLLIILFVLWFRWRKKRLSYFVDLGIPGPKPNMISGNMEEIVKKGAGKCQIEWIKKYGNVVGYFYGPTPTLLVADLELMKNFMVANHMNASKREWFIEDAGVPVPAFRNSALGIIGGYYWKEIRNIMSPSFTSKKLKVMISTVDKYIEHFLNKVEEKTRNKEIVPMYKFFSQLSFDMSMSNIFGIEDDGSKLYKRFYEDVKQLANIEYNDVIVSLAFYFPEFSPIFTFIREAKDKIAYYLGRPSCYGAYKNSMKIIHLRKLNPVIERNDFVQLLMNAGEDNQDKIEKTNTNRRVLTLEEIVANMINFSFASYDTVVSTLSFALYMMTIYPNIQDKIRKELNTISTSEDELRNSFVYGIPYLDQVINETLRYYTLIRVLVTRSVTGEIKWNSIKLPKNLVLQVAAYPMHHNPEYWENPEKFDPERFSPENKQKINPLVYQAFGHGPRNCIGMRFAQLVIRQVFTRLLLKYKFEVCDETKEMKTTSEPIVLRPANELFLRAVPV